MAKSKSSFRRKRFLWCIPQLGVNSSSLLCPSEKRAPISGKLLFRHNSLSHSLIMVSLGSCLQVCLLIFVPNNINSRDRRSSLRLGGGGGAPLVTQYWGDTRHFFLLSLYNFKNIWGDTFPLPPLLRGP